jgi:hypothetical protein
MDNTEFNSVVTSIANGLSLGADHAEIAKDLVARYGEEQAFLLYHAAKTYLAVPDPVVHDPVFDLSELSGDSTGVPLSDFLRVNEECPPDQSEIDALRECPILGTVNLGIGGGSVTVRRVR